MHRNLKAGHIAKLVPKRAPSPFLSLLNNICLKFEVAIAATDGEARDGQQQDTRSEQASLVILSDLPVLYWLGTVAIARLGSREEGVFVVISDIGRQMLVDVSDFEGGPVLASSKVSLEAWTGW